MAMNDYEHPDITAALATGYPRRRRVVYSERCDQCGCDLSETECWYKINGENYCDMCLDEHKRRPEDALLEVG